MELITGAVIADFCCRLGFIFCMTDEACVCTSGYELMKERCLHANEISEERRQCIVIEDFEVVGS